MPTGKETIRLLAAAKPAAVIVALLFAATHLTALFFFARGFLLTRTVVDFSSPASDAGSPIFDRAVVLVVDALRHDFVSGNSPDSEFAGKMPLLDIESDPRKSALLHFKADPPTTTLQRLKGLTTGSLPTFIDAGTNFAGTAVMEDNWVQQASGAGRVAFVGDDTWHSLFGSILNESYPLESLHVRDLHSVDTGVMERLPSLIANKENSVVIGHMLGVDHVGHRYGPAHPAMRQKLQETFMFVKSLVEIIDERTVLFVMGDHGMDHTGNHGGDSPDELDSALWVYTKAPVLSTEGTEFVRQIDFASTISSLLGLAIPYGSLGFPIQRALPASRYNAASTATVKQISRYCETFEYATYDPASNQSPLEYQQYVLKHFEREWISFDLPRMYIGLGILIVAIITQLLVWSGLGSRGPVDLLLLARAMASIAAVNTVIGALVGSFVAPSIEGILSGGAVGLSVGTCMGVFAVRLPIRFGKGGLIGASLVAFACASLFSNSFLISEPKVLLFLLMTALTGLLIRATRGGPLVSRLAIPYVVLLAVIIRLSACLRICREENGPDCMSTFYDSHGSSSTPIWALWTVSMLSLFVPVLLSRFFTISSSYVGVAKLLVRGTTGALIIALLFWCLDAAEVRGHLQPHALAAFRAVLSRLLLFTGLVGAPYVWWKGDLALAVDPIGGKSKEPVLAGFRNAYGSYAVLPLITFSWALFAVSKPPGIVALCGLLYSCFALYDLLDLTNLKYTLLTPALFWLLANMSYYATGHQATLASIQWDSAFVASETLIMPLAALTVSLNTLGPIILASAAATVISVWRRAPLKDPKTMLALACRASVGLSLIAAAHTCSSMISAAQLRRHLMAWKIFVPRFMFGAVALIAADIGATIGLLLAMRAITKATKVFA